MTAQDYTIAAYVVVVVLLWGYGARLFLLQRSLRQREERPGSR